MIGGILFLSCLSVCLFICLSVVNFNLRYNFWTIRERDFIIGMHTPLMIPSQMSPRSMTLWPCDHVTLKLKIAFSTLLPPGAYCCVSQTPLDFFYIYRNLIIIITFYYCLPCKYICFFFKCWSNIWGKIIKIPIILPKHLENGIILCWPTSFFN